MGSIILKREQGFTLLEVVFACAILGMGILGYSKIKASSRYSRVYSKQLSQAVLLSESQLEDFIRRGYKDTKLAGEKGVVKSYNFSDGGVMSLNSFSFVDAKWTVKEETPTELTKLIKFTGIWSGGKEIELTQVQVRP